MNEKNRILPGYVRKGKKFISPLKALVNVKPYGYIDDLLPELVWIALLHDHNDYHFGRDVLECVVKLSEKWGDLPKPNNLALQSAYIALSDEQKEQVLKRWSDSGLLERIRFSLSPLVLLYDKFALQFVGPPPQAIPVSSLIQRLERVVGNSLNKYETPAVMLHGALLLTNLIGGKLFFAEGIDVPDFNAVIDRPDSEDAKRAASFMRASAMAQIGFQDPPTEWAKSFWQSSYHLVTCESETNESL